MKKLQTVYTAISIALVSLTTFLFNSSVSLAGETNQVESTKLAPSWELADLEGKTIRSTDFKGKVVVLDFWATWCPPCRAEIPDFIALQKKYAARGLAVIGVSVDQASLKTVKLFAEKNDINYPVMIADNKIVDSFGGIDGLPTTFIIDRNGNIVKQHLGFTPPNTIEKEVKALLAP